MLTGEKRLPHALNRQKLRGIVFMSCAIFLFAVVDAIAKLVSARYPANEITFFRMLFGLIPAAFVFRFRDSRRKELTLHRFFGHFLRAVMALGSMGLFFAGLPYLPLSTAVTLQYTEAIFIGLFAVVFLSERFRVATAVASAAGFVGVALVSSFTGNPTSLPGAGLILLSAMFGAGSVIQIKKLSRTEEPAAFGSAVIIGSALYLGMSDKRVDAGDGAA